MTAIAASRLPRPRLRRIRPLLVALAAVGIVAGSYALSAVRPAQTSHPVAPVSDPVAPVSDPAAAILAAPADAPIGNSAGIAAIDHAIKAWTANLAMNANDFISATNLGLLYDTRGRLTGDLSDYQRAQEGAAKALVALPGHMPARILQARLLQTLHDFPAALAAARGILHDDPSQLQALATAGDAELELGDVAGARASFEALGKAAPGPAVTARLSRLAFIEGDTASALRLAKLAWTEADTAGQTGSSLGWYAYVAGTVALASGFPADAAGWFDRAVVEWPNSYLTLAGQARAQAALGHADQAIATYQAAIAIAPQPDSLTALGDLYALRGDAKLASDQYETVEAIGHLAALNQQVYNRQLVLFSVNHDRDLADALRMAEQELAVRKDVYGYDAYAWALLANGRAADADVAMRQALAFGTKDALLSYHAGMIAIALGDPARASTLLHDAMALTGALDPLAANRAAAALATLR